ncbi:MAG: PUA domain-containing protein [Methanomicrobiaceae archaeon]|nr:PUA domain-containing protein [Methanomicrobiaceae archaeon]
MSTGYSETSAHERVRSIADYQFGAGIGEALFPEGTEFGFSSSGRVRYILLAGERLATLRAGDGRLTLGLPGAVRLHAATIPPSHRVTIGEEVVPFVGAGKNAMAKHVIAADDAIGAGDEVLVVTLSDRLVATGVANLSGREMLAFNYGVAVKVRKGADLP